MIIGKPVRLQLSRRKGFNLQAAGLAANGLPTVSVARPGRWGNPFQIGSEGMERAEAVRRFADYVRRPEQAAFVSAVRAELAGKNLACWCPLDGQPCHGNVLLKIANSTGPVEGLVGDDGLEPPTSSV